MDPKDPLACVAKEVAAAEHVLVAPDGRWAVRPLETAPWQGGLAGDALRFYCFREVSFGNDGSISTSGFETRYESELANEYGNLASRTLAMVARYRDGKVPGRPDELVLADDFVDVAQRTMERIDRLELTGALDDIWTLVRRLNRFVVFPRNSVMHPGVN